MITLLLATSHTYDIAAHMLRNIRFTAAHSMLLIGMYRLVLFEVLDLHFTALYQSICICVS
jgi:hypothetical protein